MSQDVEIFYVTSGHIDKISPFEANQIKGDEDTAVGVCDLIGEAAHLICATQHGAVIYGTQAAALEVHNRLFTLGQTPKDNHSQHTDKNLVKAFSYAGAKFRLGTDFVQAAQRPTVANDMVPVLARRLAA